MSEYRSHFILLAIRLVVAALILFFGIRFFLPIPLFIPFVILAASIVVARPLARIFSEPAGSLFFPTDRYDRPQPIYGIPESRRKEGHYEEALLAYEAIVGDHPEEVKAWIAMLEIALRDLRDPDRGRLIHERARQALRQPEHLAALAKMHDAYREKRS